MSTRKRTRASLPTDDLDEDELSPPAVQKAGYGSVKKRKLNTYTRKSTGGIGGVLGKAAGLLGFGKGKENVPIAEREDGEGTEDELMNDEGGDIWEVPEEEPAVVVKKRVAKLGSVRRSMGTRGREVEAEEEVEEIEEETDEIQETREEVQDSEEEVVGREEDFVRKAKRSRVSTPKSAKATPKQSASKSKLKPAESVPKQSASKSATKSEKTLPKYADNQQPYETISTFENTTPKRGRPRKEVVEQINTSKAASEKRLSETVSWPVVRPQGRQRKSDVIKRDKALSREAIRSRLKEVDDEAAEVEGTPEGSQTKESSPKPRRKKSRMELELENDTGWAPETKAVEDDPEDEPLAEEVPSSRPRGRPKKIDAMIDEVKVPKGILTPTKNRGKSRKSVVFEGHTDLDLGFKDLPSSKRKTQKPTSVSPVPSADGNISEDEAVVLTEPVEADEEASDEEGSDESEEETACNVCKGLDSKKPNSILLCDGCDFAAHQKCYGVAVVPKGDWFCNDCKVNDLPDPESEEAVASSVPDIMGFEQHLQSMQRLLLDRLTGQNRMKLHGHDDEMQKVFQVVEQTILAGEGNSMLIIGARGSGKTIVSVLSTGDSIMLTNISLSNP